MRNAPEILPCQLRQGTFTREPVVNISKTMASLGKLRYTRKKILRQQDLKSSIENCVKFYEMDKNFVRASNFFLKKLHVQFSRDHIGGFK